MKYITFNGDEARSYKADYNTNKFSEEELEDICKTWTEEDNDGTDYYLADIEDEKGKNKMKKYTIESSRCESIFSKREDFHDGMCDENLCEWETQAEFDSLEEAIAEFDKKYSDSDYYDNYKSITEYKLEETEYEIYEDGEIEYGEITVIRTSKLPR